MPDDISQESRNNAMLTLQERNRASGTKAVIPMPPCLSGEERERGRLSPLNTRASCQFIQRQPTRIARMPCSMPRQVIRPIISLSDACWSAFVCLCSPRIVLLRLEAPHQWCDQSGGRGLLFCRRGRSLM